MSGERISCIMASRGHATPARHAIECYRRQTYANRELIVISADPAAEVQEWIAGLGDPTIRFIDAPPGTPVGLLRNQAIAIAQGDLVAVWDDDDLSHAERLRWQYDALVDQRVPACVVSQVLLWWPARRRMAIGSRRVWENSLLARRTMLPAYSALERGSDTHVLKSLNADHAIAAVDRLNAYVYVAHDRNLWGADHFDMLFANGRPVPAGQYDQVIASLDAAMPIRAYAAGRTG